MTTSPNHRHIKLFITLIGAALLGLAFRFGVLMLKQFQNTKRYENPVVADRVVRGTIYDRNGRILAIQTPYWGVYFHLNKIKDLELVSEVVAPFVQMSPSEIIERTKAYTTYAQISGRIDEDQVEPLLATLSKYNLLDSVNVEKRIGRTYPSLFHAAQILGFTNAEGEGIEGLEFALEKQLNPYPRVGEEQITYGNDVYLTLDMDIQYALDVQLQEIADLYDPNIIMGIIMDAKTGDILALGSYPWYDPNSFNRSTARQRTNNTISTLLEPGSVFKLFSLASVLKAGEAQLDEHFECTGSYSFQAGSSTVTINCATAHGTIDPQMMIAKSCNGAIAHWARQTDEEAFYQTLVDLGFTRSWDIGLPSRPRAQIAEPSTWSARSQATIGFGQELLTTSLHLATAATALGIDGNLLQPHLILRIADANDGTIVKQREKEVVAHLFDHADTRIIREGMHKATSDEGTGHKARVKDLEIGIKTGTAQLFNPEKNSYSDGSTLASSLALAPIDDPAYIIYIGVEGGRGWGADLAAPAIGNLVQALISQGKLRRTR